MERVKDNYKSFSVSIIQLLPNICASNICQFEMNWYDLKPKAHLCQSCTSSEMCYLHHRKRSEIVNVHMNKDFCFIQVRETNMFMLGKSQIHVCSKTFPKYYWNVNTCFPDILILLNSCRCWWWWFYINFTD